MNWAIGLLTAAAGLAAAWVIWRMRRARRSKPKAAPGVVSAIRLDAEDLAADRLPEEEWLAMADRCLAEGNPRMALRAFFLANLAWLGRLEFLSPYPGKTNREFELELRRRARPFPEARELFSGNVAGFERAWYGQRRSLAPAGRTNCQASAATPQ